MNNPATVSHLPAYEQRAQRPRAPFSQGGEAPRKFTPKGHDAQLHEAQNNQIPVRVRLVAGGKDIFGIVTKRDKFTITVRHNQESVDAGCDEILYKHAIESVMLLRDTQPA